jgi:hypothetical protein
VWGVFAILAKFYHILLYNTPVFAKNLKNLKKFSLVLQNFYGNQSALSNRQKGLASPGANGSW